MPAYEPITNKRPLAGRHIALVEHRELDRLGRMLEEQGAATLRCPLVAIADAPGAATVRAWIERAIAATFDDLVLMTGEGLRRLCGAAAHAGIEAAFREALSRMRTITRGPKPAQALREIGLSPGLRAVTPTTDGVAREANRRHRPGRRRRIAAARARGGDHAAGHLFHEAAGQRDRGRAGGVAIAAESPSPAPRERVAEAKPRPGEDILPL